MEDNSYNKALGLVNWLDESELVIFLFHGVVENCSYQVRNYTGKHIELSLFEKCIEMLSKHGTPLTMDEVLENCKTKDQFPPKSFAITFDDGFENNISAALPILEKYDVPATIYLTTRFVDENGMSWIDRIERAVEETEYKSIVFELNSKNYQIGSIKEKIIFLSEVRKVVKSMPDCNPDKIADSICDVLFPNMKIDSGMGPLDKKLTWSDIRLYSRHPLIQFGGHSHTHPILSFLSSRELDFEIKQSLSLLSEKAEISPTHYSYPEGLEHCYSDYVIERLKANGVECCPTAIEGRNPSGMDPFELRRVMVV